jgi:mannose-6-phosphate isomerase class I
MMTNYVNKPAIRVKGEFECEIGWKQICRQLKQHIGPYIQAKKIIVVECYQGVLLEELIQGITENLPFSSLSISNDLMHDRGFIAEMVFPDVTDDRIFGFMTRLTIDKYFDTQKVDSFRERLHNLNDGLHIIIGSGAAYLCPDPDLLVYADMARWEIQLRMRKHMVSNLGLDNKDTPDWMLLYKQGLFVDWRVCDRLKKQLMDKWDFVLDTNITGTPKMVSGEAVRTGLRQVVQQPFSVVPFFDPGPWGGQWMKEKCNLDPSALNYAWCFNCVPEENSLLLNFNDVLFEIPSLNVVYYQPRQLLGDAVHGRFGDEFPIRFDFLDTMEGGHLSLQVHPLTEYIQEHFGLHYTQDESYYMMDAASDALVYLGLKEGVDPEAMLSDLETAQNGGAFFETEKHVQSWPAKKHDHFLIPAGTVHCSGKNSMVLEISATPFIYTFKLWDWGRLGMDGKPRPINIERGRKVIQWNRTTGWTSENLVNRVVKVAEGNGWIEERTGLHECEFIETRRHWFTLPVEHSTHGGVNVICLVEGDSVIVESPSDLFAPFEVHYAETFIVPAAVTEYQIRPNGKSEKYATLKAFVRTQP